MKKIKKITKTTRILILISAILIGISIGLGLGISSLINKELELTYEEFMEIFKEKNPNYDYISYEYNATYKGEVNKYNLENHEDIQDDILLGKYERIENITTDMIFKEDVSNYDDSYFYKNIYFEEKYLDYSKKDLFKSQRLINIEKNIDYKFENDEISKNVATLISYYVIKKDKEALCSNSLSELRSEFYSLNYLNYISEANSEAQYSRIYKNKNPIGYRSTFKTYTGDKNAYSLKYVVDFNNEGSLTSLKAYGSVKSPEIGDLVYILDDVKVDINVSYDQEITKLDKLEEEKSHKV